MVADRGQPFAAFGHAHPPTLEIRGDTGQLGAPYLHTALLGEPLGLAAIAFRQLGFAALRALLRREHRGFGLTIEARVPGVRQRFEDHSDHDSDSGSAEH